MYTNILVAIELNDETSCCKPLLSAAEFARAFGARLHVLTMVRKVQAILEAKAATLGYDLIATDLETRIAALIRYVDASDLNPNVLVTHGASIYAEILGVADEAEADLVVVGSHRPAMKDYLLGANAARAVRQAAVRFSSPGSECGRRFTRSSLPRPCRERSRRPPESGRA